MATKPVKTKPVKTKPQRESGNHIVYADKPGVKIPPNKQ